MGRKRFKAAVAAIASKVLAVPLNLPVGFRSGIVCHGQMDHPFAQS